MPYIKYKLIILIKTNGYCLFREIIKYLHRNIIYKYKNILFLQIEKINESHLGR